MNSFRTYNVGDNRLVLYLTDYLNILQPNLDLKEEEIFGKAKINIALAELFFHTIENLVPHAFLSSQNQHMPSRFSTSMYMDHVVLIQKLKKLPFTCQVYGYVTDDFCYFDMSTSFLPRDLEIRERLPYPVVLFFDKNGKNISFDKLYNGVNGNDILRAKNYAVMTYCLCRQFVESKGFILPSLSLKFGMDTQSILRLSGDSLFPDNMTFWDMHTFGEDKGVDNFLLLPLLQYERQHGNHPSIFLDEALDDVEEQYQILYESLTGEKFI